MARRRLTAFLLCALGIVAAGTGAAKQLVTEFRGSGNTTTASFQVEGPWILDWRLDGDYEQMIALDVQLVDARTGKHVGSVLRTKYKGNGVRLFEDGGRYQFRVSSTLARWTLKVEQLTREEAELYTPRSPAR